MNKGDTKGHAKVEGVNLMEHQSLTKSYRKFRNIEQQK